MAIVPVSWNMSEADRARLVSMLCGEAGIPATLTNAKKVQAEEWATRVVAYQQRQTAVVPPVIE